MSTVVWSNTAGAICEATKRSQISWYSRSSSRLRMPAIFSGVRKTEVGRIASCASCAPSLSLNWRPAAWWSSPKRPTMYSRAASRAESETRLESVRM